MPEQNDQQSERLQSRYSVRQVTDIQASWVEQERGRRGRFTLQLILDNGVEEYILDRTPTTLTCSSSYCPQRAHHLRPGAQGADVQQSVGGVSVPGWDLPRGLPTSGMA